MGVREALPADRMAIGRMLRDAHAAAALPFAFSAAHAVALADRHMADADKLALVLDDGRPCGVLLATVQEHPFAAVMVATETAWWIDPQARGRAAMAMLAAYEAWSRERGAVLASMAALACAPTAATIYRRRGYEPIETHYLKAL